MAASTSHPAAREIPALERSLEDLERRLGPYHEDDLGDALEACGRPADAGRAYTRALAIESTEGPGHPDTANILDNLAGVRPAQGDYAAMTRGLSAASAGLVLLASLGCSDPGAPPTRDVSPVAGGDAVEVLDFEAMPTAGWLPAGWEPYAFRSIERATVYSAAMEHGHPVLRGNSRAGASALRRKVSIAASRHPIIEWSWNVAGSIPGADCTRKETDDCAARILILYRFVPERASLAERLEFESARTARGEYPPSAMLVYAWMSSTAPAEPFPSPRSDRVRMIPVERGDERAGTWVTERRDHLADYREAFGEDPPPIDSVAFMVDTDDTGQEATAGLESLRFLPPTGP